ncbi:hypothetical protein QR46_4889 [Giardia duodenalis assemblage B]|uniref:Uncharacterized protein n=1 Tax=Giardia duodenalis assemblage B TaxID=1394984 RepID=A0A132NM60_GIAIN|nr:hypothetical protein QR46_4889 [Giardia intestinalis assemblage B]
MLTAEERLLPHTVSPDCRLVLSIGTMRCLLSVWKRGYFTTGHTEVWHRSPFRAPRTLPSSSASIQAGPALAAVRDGRHTGRRAAPRSAPVHYQGVQQTACKFWGLQLHQVKGIVNGLEKISVL